MFFSKKKTSHIKAPKHSRFKQQFIMPLEPRIMFDAAAVATVDAAVNAEAADSCAKNTADTAVPVAKHEVAFIDTTLQNSSVLLAGLDKTVEVVALQSGQDPLKQISDYLASHNGINALHLFSHGTPGSVRLGETELAADTLKEHAQQLESWKQSLTADADILLYGCDVAAGTQGEVFITQLASLTGADVAASIDPTGASSKGGDWNLESKTGSIEAATLAVAGYDTLLAAPVNTVPTARTVAEDNTITFSGNISVTTMAVNVNVQISVAHGSLTLSGISGLTFVSGADNSASMQITGTITNINSALNGLIYSPTKDYAGADTLTIATTDGTTTDTDSVGITVTANATAPVLTLPTTAQTVAEDTATYLDFTGSNAITLTDADANDLQTLTLSVAHGTLNVTVVGGATVASGNGTASVVLSGTAAQLSATLADSQGVSYTSSLNYNGADALQFALSDGVHSASSSVAVNVTPVNDAPSIVVGSHLSVPEGGDVAFSATQFNYNDVDNVTQQVIFRIDTLPDTAAGRLTFNGYAIQVNSTFSADQIARLHFVHSGSDVVTGSTASFTVSVNDGAGGADGAGAWSASQQITVDLTPVNTAPSISGAATVTAFEGRSNVPITLTISDVESNHADAYDGDIIEIFDLSTGLAGGTKRGTLYFDANGNNTFDAGDTDISALAPVSGTPFMMSGADRTKLRYSDNGSDPATSPAISFVTRVQDQGGGQGAGAKLWSADTTITIPITANDDDPTLSGTQHADVTATSGASTSVVLTTAMLHLTDLDSSDPNLVYTLETRPTEGVIEIDIDAGVGETWKVLGIGGRFTQAMLDNAQVRYIHEVIETGGITDQFTFTSRDSTLTTRSTDWSTVVEGGVRDSGTGGLQVNTFTIAISGDGGNLTEPRDPDTGYGGDAGLSTDPANSVPPTEVIGISKTNDDYSASGWVVQINETGSGTIKNTMINYEIIRNGVTSPASEVVYTLKTVPPNGTLLKDGVAIPLYGTWTQADVDANKISFHHDGNEIFRATFDYFVSDGGPNGINGTFTLNIRPINDAPSASGGPTVQLIEGATIRLGSSALGVSDADGAILTGGAADAVKLLEPEGNVDNPWFRVSTLPLDGTLEYWNGTIWQAVETTMWFPKEILTRAADTGTSGLRYVHGGDDAVANLTDALQFEVRDDLTAPVNADEWVRTGLAAPAAGNKSGTATLNLEIAPMNDAPLVPLDKDAADITQNDSTGTPQTAINNLLTVTEGGTGTITDELYLKAVDSDNTTIQRQFRITDNVNVGTLYLSGKALGVGSVFTQDDINNDRVTYRHNGSETFADQFKFKVSDGVATTAEATFDIVITPANDTPTLAAPTSLDVFGSGATAVAVNGVVATDVDLAAITSGETNFLHVEVQLLDSTNNLVASGLVSYSGADPAIGGANLGYVLGKGSNSLIIQGTKVEVDDILSSLTVAYSADRDVSNDKLRIIVDDRLYGASGALTVGANGGLTNADGTEIDATHNRATKDITLRASNTNDPPTITNATSYSVNEDALLTLNGFTLTDVDSFSETVTVKVELFSDAGRTTLATASEGTLTYSGLSNVTAAGTGTNTVTLSGTKANVETALNSLKFDNATDYNGPGMGNGTLYLKTTFTDFGHADVPGGNAVTLNNDITIVPVNDQPVLSAPGNQIMNSGTYLDITSGFAVQDTKDISQGATDYIEVTVAATKGGSAYGTISIQTPGAATVVGDGTDTVIVKGLNAVVQAALNSMRYTPTDPNVDSIITMTVTADDRSAGVGNGMEVVGVDGNNTVVKTFTIDTSGSNNAPVVTIPAPLSVVEDISPNDVLGVSFLDSDDFGGVERVTLTVTHGTINMTTTTGLTVIAGAYNSATVTVDGTKAALNTALATLKYSPTANYHGSATLTVTASDKGLTGTGGAQTDTEIIDITVTPVNDQPTASSNVTLAAIAEDSGPSPAATLNTLAFGYSDSTDNQTANSGGDTSTAFSYLAVVGNAATASQGVWQISDGSGGWISVPAAGLATTSALIIPSDRLVRFDPAANFHGTPGALSVRLADASVDLSGTGKISTDAATRFDISQVANGGSGVTGAWNSTNRTIGISVTNVNDAPTRTAATVSLTAVDEDAPNPAGNLVSTLFTAVYSDGVDNQTAAGGANAANIFAGVAITDNAEDASHGKWQYSTDGASWTDLPAVTSATALALKSTDHLRFLPNVLNYNGSAGGLTARLIDNSSGAVTTGTTLDLSDDATKSGGTTPYSNSSNAVTLNTSVNPINDAPTITGTATDPTYTEGGSIVALITGGGATDVDLPGTVTFGGGKLTITLDAYRPGDTLSLAGAPAGVASTSGGNAAALVINLNTAATPANLGAILEAIRFSNSGNDPTVHGTDTDRTYSVTLNDGNNVNGAANAGGPASLDSNILTGTITLVATNDPPVAVNDTHAVTEDSGVASTGNAITGVGSPNTTADSDPDNVIGDLSLSGIRTGTEGAGGAMTAITAGSTSVLNGTVVIGTYGTLTIGADGSYSYALDNTNPTVNALQNAQTLSDVFSYTLKDPANLTDVAQISITINGHSDGGTLAISPVDGNAAATGQASVYESGLTADGPALQSKTTTGSILVDAPDGIASVTIGGTTFTVAQLSALSVGSPSAIIDTGEGELRVTGMTVTTGPDAAPKAAQVSYTYTLKATITNATPATTEITDTIALLVTDKSAGAATAAGNLLIQIVDDTPTANPDTNSITKGSASVAGNVVSVGAGVDRIGADTTATPVSAIAGGAIGVARAGSYGSLTLANDGSYTYALDNANPTISGLMNGQTKTDSFTYTITDADGDTSTTTLTITINGDQLPVAVNDSFTINEDTPLTSTLTGNDTLSGDGGNVWTKATDPAHGTVVMNADGTFTYTPTANYHGPDSFTYTITDADGDTSTATVTLTVTPVDDVPVAVNDSFTTNEDTPLTSTLTGNDTPSGDGGNVWSKATDPTHGTVTVNADGTFTYTPTANYHGPDSFTYTITDADGDTSTATVTLTVTPVDDVPVAVNDSFTINEDTPLTSTLTGNDTPSGDGGNVWTKATDPAHGTVVMNADGTFTYTPTANYHGPDSFTYTITDADGDTSTATVTLTITSVDDVPVAVNDSFTINEDTPLTGTLTGNDTPSGDGGNVWTKATSPAHGTVTVNADGTFTYTPTANYHGPDSFTYTITDADGDTSTATVTLTITSVDDVPVAVNDSFTTDEDTPLTATLTGNDTPSGDGGNVWTKATDPAHGTVVMNADGTFTYTPATDFSGPDSFTYTITDADGDTSTATVTLIINAVPPPPPPPAEEDDEVDEVDEVVVMIQPVDPPAPDSLPALVPGLTTSVAPTGSSFDFVLELTEQDILALDLSTVPGTGGGVVSYGDETALSSTEYNLYLIKTPSSQEVLVEEVASFNLPTGTFKHSSNNAKVALEATLADGRPLPSWLTFDPDSGRFTGKPPKGTGGNMDIKVMARDDRGNVAFTQFLLHITELESQESQTLKERQPDRNTEDINIDQQNPAARETEKLQQPKKKETTKGRSSLSDQFKQQKPYTKNTALIENLQNITARLR